MSITANSSTGDLLKSQANVKASKLYNYVGLNCLQVDELLKKITNQIVLERNKKLEGKGDDYFITALVEHKALIETFFVTNKCRDKIEELRLTESGALLTKQSIQQEQNVLSKNYKEQYLYIGLGATLLLTGLYLILKK